jgi:serine/threonine protein kinase
MLIKDKVLQTLYNNARILHRDISPNNIMLARDEHGKVLHALLIDFDYASTLADSGTVASNSGTADGGDVVDRFRTVSLFPFAFPSFIYPYRRGHHHLWPSRFCCKRVEPSITAFDMI